MGNIWSPAGSRDSRRKAVHKKQNQSETRGEEVTRLSLSPRDSFSYSYLDLNRKQSMAEMSSDEEAEWLGWAGQRAEDGCTVNHIFVMITIR